MRALRLIPILAFALLAALGHHADPVAAQPAASAHRTPAGIAFHHLAVPGDSHHALSFAWSDGHALGPGGKEGLAILGPRLVMEGGSRSTSESERVERLKDLQASIGLAGSAYHTRGQLTAPKATFAEAAGLLADLLADPALPPARLARAKRAVAIASRQADERPETVAERLFRRLTLGEGPLLRFYSSDLAAYEAVEVADVDAWRRAVLGRERLTIASAGPMSPDEIAREIDRVFAALPAVGAADGPRPALRGPGKLVVLERPAVQTAIVAGGPASWKVAIETLPGSVAVRILGGSGFQGRLMKAVREGLGAAYGIRAGLQQPQPTGFSVVINTMVDNARAAAVIAAIRGEYARLRDGGVTAAELDAVKTKLVADARQQLRRAPAAAQWLRDLLIADYPADYIAGYEGRVQALGVEAVNANVRAHFPTEPLTIVMVAPSADGLGADCVIRRVEEVGRCE